MMPLEVYQVLGCALMNDLQVLIRACKCNSQRAEEAGGPH